ncbi:helix-turn-helix domain-containing protein [Enterococcus raffinosus]|uniref:Winged helix-turn-helix domain-containing protein n=1 Tax=Enterococcus raffinosus TaxID=71452 RepID=A0AAW8TAL1_9ENTE|nr:winged helix-turn-helix domain-containing protein [Enterococcus raffinosus]MDT2524965.1 winged helix-turn-helix domain-containing protein [Enterococcus raffinosus]MDT2531307.1 winged helix-turn-helix domain-containing protein [Enterococcus raffinosus]MDT2535682.1 winged helix-turn-helix domain-containing protein [Enterococcus raffinosus]MDT2545988.1 winged helix-turn-helix domain-containing protein [Enterococcus raffinosus]MDT2556038.1 winged helix-turn-helix domain-containing protein [Ente
MERILIITKNTLAEKGLQEQLQLMNYEVLCHQGTTIDDILCSDGPAFLDFFDCMIISETLSQLDYQKILADLARREKQPVILRKSEGQERLREGEENILPTDASFEKLREILVTCLGFPQPNQAVSSVEMLSMQLERIQWTNKERDLFRLLQENAGTCLGRETICQTLWGEYSNSTKAQLSNLTKQIREKLELSGIGGDKLVTLWGQGYRLDKVLKAI